VSNLCTECWCCPGRSQLYTNKYSRWPCRDIRYQTHMETRRSCQYLKQHQSDTSKQLKLNKLLESSCQARRTIHVVECASDASKEKWILYFCHRGSIREHKTQKHTETKTRQSIINLQGRLSDLSTTLCLKNVTTLSCCYLDIHDSILINLGTIFSDKVRKQKVLNFAHHTTVVCTTWRNAAIQNNSFSLGCCIAVLPDFKSSTSCWPNLFSLITHNSCSCYCMTP